MSVQGSATETVVASNGHNPIPTDILKKKLANMRVLNGNSHSSDTEAESPRTAKTAGNQIIMNFNLYRYIAIMADTH